MLADRVIVLAHVAERAEDIDLARVCDDAGARIDQEQGGVSLAHRGLDRIEDAGAKPAQLVEVAARAP